MCRNFKRAAASCDPNMSEFESNNTAEAPAPAQVVVKKIDGQVADMREVNVTTTAAQLRALVAETTGLPVSKFSLALGENCMDDARSLAAHGIDGGAEVEVMMLIDTHTLETDETALLSALSQLGRGDLVNGKSVREWGFVEIKDERIVKVDLNGKNLRGASLCSTLYTIRRV